MSESHKHDYWAEHLTDEEIEARILLLLPDVWEKKHAYLKLQFQVDRLERERERRKRDSKPALPPPLVPTPGPIPTLPEPFSPVPLGTSNCGLCGLKLEGVMGYVCSRNDCPTGLGGPTCM